MKTIEMSEFRKCLSSHDKFMDFCSLHSSILYTDIVGVRAGIRARAISGEVCFSFYGIHKITCYIFVKNGSLLTLWFCGRDANRLNYRSLPQEFFLKLGKQEQTFIFKNIDVFTLNGFLNE